MGNEHKEEGALEVEVHWEVVFCLLLFEITLFFSLLLVILKIKPHWGAKINYWYLSSVSHTCLELLNSHAYIQID